MDGFIMENPIKMDDLGIPSFLETPISSSYRINIKQQRPPRCPANSGVRCHTRWTVGPLRIGGSLHIYIYINVYIYIYLYHEWFISDDPMYFFARYVSCTRLLCEGISWYFDMFDASILKRHATHDTRKTQNTFYRSQFHLTSRHWHFTPAHLFIGLSSSQGRLTIIP